METIGTYTPSEAWSSKAEEIIWLACSDAISHGLDPSTKRYGLKTKFYSKSAPYGEDAEELYMTAYWAANGYKEDIEIINSKWGYKIDNLGNVRKVTI